MKVFLCILNVVMAVVAVGVDLPTCDLYRVETRVAGGEWHVVGVRPALMAKPKGYLSEPAEVAFASVETAFPVEVRVTPKTPFAAAEIRPRARGLVVNQCPIGGSEDVTIENVKAITHYGWGDGFNVFASSNVSYRNIFDHRGL